MTSRLRHQITQDGVIVTALCGAVAPISVKTTLGEMRRFAWSVLNDLDPDEPSVDTTAKDMQTRLGLPSPGATRLLAHLLERRGSVVPREALAGLYPDAEPAIVKVHTCHVRAALRDLGIHHAITTFWGQGSKLELEAAAKIDAILKEVQ